MVAPMTNNVVAPGSKLGLSVIGDGVVEIFRCTVRQNELGTSYDLDEIIIIGDAPTNTLGAIKEFIDAMTASGRIENLAYVVLTDQLAAIAFGQGALTADDLSGGEEADTPDETSITIRGKDFGSGIGTFDVKILCANGLNPIGLDHKGEWMTV